MATFGYEITHPTKPEYMGYAEFDLAGHNFRAWQPGGEEAPRQWLIEVKKGDELVVSRTVEMTHQNIFGPDVEDLQALNDEIENIIKELKLE